MPGDPTLETLRKAPAHWSDAPAAASSFHRSKSPLEHLVRNSGVKRTIEAPAKVETILRSNLIPNAKLLTNKKLSGNLFPKFASRRKCRGNES